MYLTRPAQFEDWGVYDGCPAIKIVELQIDDGHILHGVITGIHAIIDIKHSCIQDSILNDVLGVELGGLLGVGFEDVDGGIDISEDGASLGNELPLGT
jgi:hypothetical protein